MSKEEFVELLKSKGIDAELESGVVMVLYEDVGISPTAVYRKFNLAKKIADDVGYNSSIGIRKKGKGYSGAGILEEIPGEENEEHKVETEEYEQMELF